MIKIRKTFLQLILLTTMFHCSILYSKIDLENLTFKDWKNNKITNEDRINIIKKANEKVSNILTENKDYWPLLSNDEFNTLKNNINTLQENDSFIPPNICSCPIIPHVQKLVIKNSANLYFLGCLYGNKSNFLDLLKIIINDNLELNENTYLIFLGNYVDGGFDNLMVLTTIMLLKIKNPYNVFILRGKHENSEINKQCGFHKELRKNKKRESLINQINIFYELMPAALYINYDKSKFFHASNAGVEIRYNTQKFLDAKIENSKNIQFDLLENLKTPPFIQALISEYLWYHTYCHNKNPIFGFLWNDFIWDGTENEVEKSGIYSKIENFFLSSGNKIGLRNGWSIGGIKHNYECIKMIFEKYDPQNKFTKFICSSNHKIPKAFTFNKKTNKLNSEELNLQTDGISPTNKKIITVISTSIRYPEYEIKYISSFLHVPISFPEQKEQNYEQNI